MKYRKSLVATLTIAAINVIAAMPVAAQPICNIPSLVTRTTIDVGLAVVSRAATLQERACPKINSRDCRAKEKVKAGTIVVTGPSFGQFTCVIAGTEAGSASGWMATSQLRRQPVAKLQPLSGWVGKWTSPDTGINVALEGNHLRAKGDAFSRTRSADEKHLHVGAVIGHIEMAGIPQKDRLWGDKNCQVELMLVGSYMLVDDENDCGGDHNATFAGIYKGERAVK